MGINVKRSAGGALPPAEIDAAAGGKPVAKAEQVSSVQTPGVDPAKGSIAGFSRYGGPLGASEPKPRPQGVRAAADQVRETGALATRYIQAGKLHIAGDVLREAAAALEAIAERTGWTPQSGPHPGFTKGGANIDAADADALRKAHKALTQAEQALEAAKASGAAAVGPVKGSPVPQKKIVMLYGTSGNPPTGQGGHAGIVSWGAKHLKVDLPNDEKPHKAIEQAPVDEVWVLPVYKHAFASKSNLLPFEHRVAMAKLGFENLPGLEGRIKVVEAEKDVVEAAFAQAEDPSKVRIGTIDLVRKLMDDHPGVQFVLALGGDTYQDLHEGKWKEGDTLQQLLPIVVIPRAGVENVRGTEDNAPQLTDISSSKVRAAFETIRNGEASGSEQVAEAWKLVNEALHPDVIAYILENKLY